MSDTNKCPVCGGGVEWNDDGYKCRPCRVVSWHGEKSMRPSVAYAAAMHRIRELEERIAAKDEALSLIVDGATQIAREALEK